MRLENPIIDHHETLSGTWVKATTVIIIDNSIDILRALHVYSIDRLENVKTTCTEKCRCSGLLIDTIMYEYCKLLKACDVSNNRHR